MHALGSGRAIGAATMSVRTLFEVVPPIGSTAAKSMG